MRVAPEITGITGEIRASDAKRLKNWSSGPNTIEGRSRAALPKPARTAASPCALLRP